MKKLLTIFIGIFLIAFLTGCDNNKKENTYSFKNLESDFKKLDSSLTVIKKAAELVSAEEGYGYVTDDCNIEVYKFDIDSDAYKDALENQKLYMPSFNMNLNAVVKDGYAHFVTEGSCDEKISYINKLRK